MTIVRNLRAPTLSGVAALLRIVKRALDLGLPENHPIAVFTGDGTVDGTVQFINADHITDKLQKAAHATYNITDPEEIAHCTSHSIRVGARVARQDADLDEIDIKHALRRCSNTFWNYLRYLPRQAQRMATAVADSNPMELTELHDD